MLQFHIYKKSPTRSRAPHVQNIIFFVFSYIFRRRLTMQYFPAGIFVSVARILVICDFIVSYTVAINNMLFFLFSWHARKKLRTSFVQLFISFLSAFHIVNYNLSTFFLPNITYLTTYIFFFTGQTTTKCLYLMSDGGNDLRNLKIRFTIHTHRTH